MSECTLWEEVTLQNKKDVTLLGDYVQVTPVQLHLLYSIVKFWLLLYKTSV